MRAHYEKVICACCFLVLFTNIGLPSTSFAVYQPYIVAIPDVGDTDMRCFSGFPYTYTGSTPLSSFVRLTNHTSCFLRVAFLMLPSYQRLYFYPTTLENTPAS